MDQQEPTPDELEQLRPTDPHEEQARPDPDPEHPSEGALPVDATANPDRTTSADIGDLLDQAQPVELPEDDDLAE